MPGFNCSPLLGATQDLPHRNDARRHVENDRPFGLGARYGDADGIGAEARHGATAGRASVTVTKCNPAERCYGAGDDEMPPSLLPINLWSALMAQPNDLSRSLEQQRTPRRLVSATWRKC